MDIPKTKGEFYTRLNKAITGSRRRDDMVTLAREMYLMKWERTSPFLGARSNAWRSKVAPEYFCPSSRPQNVVDMMTAVLTGHPPQYMAYEHGSVSSTIPSRAEKFLMGVWGLNSRRQGLDIYRQLVFWTVLDGACALRIYWNPRTIKPDNIETIVDPESSGEEPPQPPPQDMAGAEAPQQQAKKNTSAVATWQPTTFPIVIEPVPIGNVYPVGRGPFNQPFDEIFHVEERSPSQVITEWGGVPQVNFSFADKLNTDSRRDHRDKYVEWWGRDPEGLVWHAVYYMDTFVVPPRQTNYPCIPYVISTFKNFDRNDDLPFLPFLFPMFNAVNKEEWLNSRFFRLTDMYANLPPIKKGGSKPRAQGTWGKVMHLQEGESLEFPKFPGSPPDVMRMIEDFRVQQQESSFSPAMFGQLSARSSGYAMQQVTGADTIRTDTPRSNIELSLEQSASIIFALMHRFMPDIHIGVTEVIGNRKLSAMLSGREAKGLMVRVTITPKQLADEVRMAAIGAQLASLPDRPISLAYILEKYFNIQQPEDELQRKQVEDVMKDPLVKQMALLEALADNNHPMLGVVQQAFMQTLQKAGAQGGGMEPAGPPPQGGGMEQLGMGLPQAVGGNPPMEQAFGPPNMQEPLLPERGNMMFGGPPLEGM